MEREQGNRAQQHGTESYLGVNDGITHALEACCRCWAHEPSRRGKAPHTHIREQCTVVQAQQCYHTSACCVCVCVRVVYSYTRGYIQSLYTQPSLML